MKDWQPTAYSPLTKLLYIPHQHLCMDYKTGEVGYIAGTPYVGATVNMYAGPGDYRGEFAAWDLTKRKKVWAIHEKFPVWTGTMVTAGNIAVYGTMDRWFKVVDARNGKLLYQFHAPSRLHRPADHLSGQGRQPVSSRCCRASAAGPARSPMRRSIRACATARSATPARWAICRAYTSGGSTLHGVCAAGAQHAAH